MEFLKDLHEARMTRNSSNQRVLTYTDCCERLYLSMLVLELLRQFPQFRGTVKEYAKRTSGYTNYNIFRMSGTDLYNFVYFVVGDDKALDKLKDPAAAKKIRQNTHFPVMGFNRYVSLLSNAQEPTNISEFFIKTESALNIVNADYKTVRRGLLNFRRLSTTDKKKLVTRLLFACRTKLRSSDLIDDIEKLAVLKDFETGLIKDPEPKVSVPDVDTVGKDFLYYRFIVGQENIMLAKKFLDYAKAGQSVPASMVQAYLPAVKLLDDIVSGGPSYINLLRTLQKRAKKDSNS